MDFSTNPFTTVLIPEPIDYFAACSATSVCEAKCFPEISSFQQAKAKVGHSFFPAPTL